MSFFKYPGFFGFFDVACHYASLAPLSRNANFRQIPRRGFSLNGLTRQNERQKFDLNIKYQASLQRVTVEACKYSKAGVNRKHVSSANYPSRDLQPKIPFPLSTPCPSKNSRDSREKLVGPIFLFIE